MVYQELRELAARTLANGAPGSVQPTDLLHEAYVRMARERQGWDSRTNFMVAAAVAMRRARVDHLRSRRAAKRGGELRRVDALDHVAIEDRRFDTLELADALERLEAQDGDAAQVAELRLFGGYDCAACAEAIGASRRTVERRWRFARAWLLAKLSGGEGAA